jgi:hypothetical protein
LTDSTQRAQARTENSGIKFTKQNTSIANTLNPFLLIFVTAWERKKLLMAAMSMIVSCDYLWSDRFLSSFESAEGRMKFSHATSAFRFILIVRNLNGLREMNRKHDLVLFSVKLDPRRLK